MPNNNVKHGLSKHPLYRSWTSMNDRCYNPKNKQFKNYGAVGVEVCTDWRNDFIKYFNWAICNGWEVHLQIDKDKIGNGLLYSPLTCSIITRKENLSLKKNNLYFTYQGERKTLKQLSEFSGVNYFTLRQRLLYGWEINRAINTNINKKY